MPSMNTKAASFTIECHDIAQVVEFSPFEWSSQLLAIGTTSRVAVVNCSLKEDGDLQHESVRDFHHGCRVSALAWSPQTSLTDLPRSLKFCTGGSDKKLRIFSSDLKDDDRVKILEGHENYINSVCYEPDTGSQVASVSDDYTCRIWSTEDGHQMAVYPLGAPGMTVAWHPQDPLKLLVAEKGGMIRIYSISSNQPIMSLSSGHTPLMSCDWSLSNPIKIVAMVPGSYLVFDTTTSSYPICKKQVHSEGGQTVRVARCSENLVATLGRPRSQIKVTNTRNEQVVFEESCHVLNGLSWHHHSSLLAAGGDRKVHIWHIM
ncbi:unnamed protein product [Owenia fusiformis]|uniref:Nucleoporin Nup37 n=1 Tax=Owenia fusiformis TaxID=6347 RepID=A0A8J1TA76_OWEFU|nr:unnamed protein product [Owenia fusiformis]